MQTQGSKKTITTERGSKHFGATYERIPLHTRSHVGQNGCQYQVDLIP